MKYLKYVLAFFVCNAIAQDFTGYTFVDKDLVSGVEVLNETTLESTFSDDKGKFVINAEIGHKLKFVHKLVKEKSIEIKDNQVLKVFLKQNSNYINEVVVEGSNFQYTPSRQNDRPKYIESAFGPIKVKSSGHSTTYIGKEKLKTFNGISLQRALSGRVSNYNSVSGEGVYLGRNSDFAVWDIDGSIFQGQPPFIDLGLVEEVYIIRSLSAVVKYGTIARGGIIIVRTLLSDNLRDSKNSQKLDKYEINNDDIISTDNLYSLVEEDTLNSKVLRYISLKYQLKGEDELALRLNRFIASKDSENISSIRSLAGSYLNRNNRIQALNVYRAFLERNPDLNEKSYDIVYNDMLHIYKNLSYIEKQSMNLEMINNQDKLPDTRIVFEWSAPNEILLVEFKDTKNKSLKSQLGDAFNNNLKAEEYFVHNEGNEKIKLNLSLAEKKQIDGYLKVTIYNNWLSNKNSPEIKVYDLSRINENNYELLDLAYDF